MSDEWYDMNRRLNSVLPVPRRVNYVVDDDDDDDDAMCAGQVSSASSRRRRRRDTEDNFADLEPSPSKFVPLPLWDREREKLRRLGAFQVDDDNDACPVCLLQTMVNNEALTGTFLGELMQYDQKNCMQYADAFIVQHMLKLFHERFLPEYEMARRSNGNLPGIRKWTPAAVYQHFIAPTRHDRSNPIRTYKNLQVACDCNVEELLSRAWREDEDDENQQQCLPTDKCQQLLDKYMSLNLRILQSIERVTTKQERSDQRSQAPMTSGYGRAEQQTGANQHYFPSIFI